MKSLSKKNITTIIASRKPKVLSICLMGRNDDYTHDFMYRMTTTINYLSRNLSQLGRLDDVEFVITDWGSKTPLAESLALSPDASRVCRFIYVPEALVEDVQSDPNGFHLSLAANTSMRRACGKFILQGQADVLITRRSFEVLLKLLDGDEESAIRVEQTLLVCPRYHIPWQFVQLQPGLEEWDRYLLMNASELNYAADSLLDVGCGAGGLLMHRDLLEKSRGYDERYGGWGFQDIDLSLRLSQNHGWLGLSTFGITFYHMGHAPVGRRVVAMQPQNQNPLFFANTTLNSQDWGLGGHELLEQRGRTETVDSVRTPVDKQGNQISGILSELANSRVYNHVLAAINHFPGHTIPREEIEALFFLDWYSSEFYPKVYVELGILSGLAAAAVAAASPGVEIYGIDDWEGIPTDWRNPLFIAKILRYRVGHRAMVRFLNGPIATGIERLRKSFIGDFRPDLAFVRGGKSCKNIALQVADLLKDLCPPSAIIVTCPQPATLITFCMEWRKQCPQGSFFLSESGCACMVLVKTAATPASRESAPEICKFDVTRVIRWNKRQRLIKWFAELGLYSKGAVRILNYIFRRQRPDLW